MSQLAIETFSTLGVGIFCIVLAIMSLTIFFRVLNWLESSGAKHESIRIRGILKKDTWAKIYTVGSETFDRVRLIGFTDTDTFKTHLPHNLTDMVILEDQDKRRFLIRTKAIRMIVIEPDAQVSVVKQA